MTLLCLQGYKTVPNTSAAVKLNLPVVLTLTGLERRGRMFVDFPSKRRGRWVSSDKQPVRGPRLGWAASPACAGDDEQPGRLFRE